MIINRDDYVKKLVAKRWNGKVKIITGIRRCGKSFLLSTLYKEYLKAEGVADDSFVEIALDKRAHLKYRNPNMLYEYVLSRTQDITKRYYVFIDEIQLSFKIKNPDIEESQVPEEDQEMLYITFYDILNDLMEHEIDFIVNTGREKVYIQSALNVDTDAKRAQETFSLKNSGDFFRKIVIVDGNTKPWTDENGITYAGVTPFLLDETVLNM